jgi:CO/xanthine dehydrogenase Mo-binding subunit
MSLTSPIGQSVRRVDGGEKVTGLTRYAADLTLPGTVHARLVLSPHAHARITRVGTQAAVDVPGVLGVFTADDLKLANMEPTSRPRAPLAVNRVLFTGHPVVAVVAETAAIAEDAAMLVEVEYDVLPPAVDVVDAMGKDAPPVRASDGASGDAELAMHGAATSGARLQEAGWPLLERMPYNEHGHLLSATLMDYALPQSDQAPSIDTILVEVPSDHGPFGAKGVGEPPVVGVPAAIANALADATGQRFTELPITSEIIGQTLQRPR